LVKLRADSSAKFQYVKIRILQMGRNTQIISPGTAAAPVRGKPFSNKAGLAFQDISEIVNAGN
jgi:hypothetical protein